MSHFQKLNSKRPGGWSIWVEDKNFHLDISEIITFEMDGGLVPGLEQGRRGLLDRDELVVDPALCGPPCYIACYVRRD